MDCLDRYITVALLIVFRSADSGSCYPRLIKERPQIGGSSTTLSLIWHQRIRLCSMESTWMIDKRSKAASSRAQRTLIMKDTLSDSVVCGRQEISSPAGVFLSFVVLLCYFLLCFMLILLGFSSLKFFIFYFIVFVNKSTESWASSLTAISNMKIKYMF